jgi:DNA-binding transcriptional LysR family regulator
MLNVTLSQLAAFERVVRLGGFHAAAADLGLTQPAISQRVRELEDGLGVKLFIRQGRRVSITADGMALLSYADQLLRTAHEMTLRLRTRDPLKGVLRLGLSETFALVCLTTLLERLERQYPALKTSLHVGDTNATSELLNEQKLDLAVISEPRVDDHVRREPIGANQHRWFARASRRLHQAPLSPAELCGHHLIVTPPPAQLHSSVSRWFEQAGVAPQRLSMCNSLSVTMLTIEQGLAIGLVPERVMQDSVARGAVAELTVLPLVPAHQVWICYQVEELGQGLRQVVEIIREIVTEKRLFA